MEVVQVRVPHVPILRRGLQQRYQPHHRTTKTQAPATAPSPSSTPAHARFSTSASKSRSRTWPASARSKTSPAVRPRKAPKRTSHLAVHPSAPARNHPRPHLDPHLRQRPPHRGAARRSHQRPCRRTARPAPITARSPAAQRTEIEELLKAGRIKALVCTSSLELGIDMGAIDLVIQIEAPPSVASGLQRIGRAGHQVGMPSNGIIFPQIPRRPRRLRRRHPRDARRPRRIHPLPAQPARHPRPSRWWRSWHTRQWRGLRVQGPGFRRPRWMRIWAGSRTRRCSPWCAAPRPFAAVTIQVFEGVLDMLAGRYPSDEFAELRPRITWGPSTRNWLTPAPGASRASPSSTAARSPTVAFTASSSPEPAASPSASASLTRRWSSSRATATPSSSAPPPGASREITHDRVLVSPAPRHTGQDALLARRSGWPPARIRPPHRRARPHPARDASQRRPSPALTTEHDLDPQAAENVLRYLRRPGARHHPTSPTTATSSSSACATSWATGACAASRPSAAASTRPGRWRSPRASAPTAARRSKPCGPKMASSCAFPKPTSHRPPTTLLMEPEEASELVLRQLGSTALFAAKFRESASRALLLACRADAPTAEPPLWQQRKRAYDLLSVASRYESFPILLEALPRMPPRCLRHAPR